MGGEGDLQRRVPAPGRVDPRQCLAELSGAPCGEPFAPEVMAFFGDLSQRLFALEAARAFPEIQVLAYFLRKASIQRLEAEFRVKPGSRAPRGTAFHVPPGNVETIFCYTWALSALVGNRNVVRLSPRRSTVTDLLCTSLNQAFSADSSGLGRRTLMLEYEHEREVSVLLSEQCDVRVLWGGDRAVQELRSLPLPPRAVELTFPDRVSYAALDSAALLALDEEQLHSLAEKLYVDAYWFDQKGCSSPRALIFCGTRELGSRARARLLTALAAAVERRGYRVSTDTALAKRRTAEQLVIDAAAHGLEWRSNELVALEVPNLAASRRELCGGGLFLLVYLDDLTQLSDGVAPGDQTLTHFGFDAKSLTEFGRSVQGRGLDRIVPLGKALEFSHLWDGYDLLESFTRVRDIRSD
jgi:hypothetical protein